ncbi:MAG: hypothetical protein PUF91_03340 [Lactobacillus delbrueckii]|nr:hypothetical protein [Lactobacillus delbrueckii]
MIPHLCGEYEYNLIESLKNEVPENVRKYINENMPDLRKVDGQSKTYGLALDSMIFSTENIAKTGGIADIYSGITGVDLAYGHKYGYFKQNSKIASEFFANTVSAEIENSEGIEFQRLIAPNITKAVEDMIDKISRQGEIDGRKA